MFATHADKPKKTTKRQLERKAKQARRKARKAQAKARWKSR